VAFAPNGRMVASGSCDNTVRLWDPTLGALKKTLVGHSDSIWSVAFSPDSRLLASGSSDNTIQLWNHDIGTLQRYFKVTGQVTSMRFSEDDSYLITNLGCLEIRSSHDGCTSEFSLADEKISLSHDCWVTLHGEKVLWLPPEYRPSSWTIKGNTLILGHGSGRISFMEPCA
jgi:WD40 repeat protein